MKILHVAKIYPKGLPSYLFLKEEEGRFLWEGTTCGGQSLEEALKEGSRMWKQDYFTLLHCGFRYSLPIRDEVGVNALFWQMAKSYATFNGIYFDEDVGHMCLVKFASQEALKVWKKIS